jgi:hypothetical protein
MFIYYIAVRLSISTPRPAPDLVYTPFPSHRPYFPKMILYPLLSTLFSAESVSRAKKKNVKNIQQRVFASGHPPDY